MELESRYACCLDGKINNIAIQEIQLFMKQSYTDIV
jgi:hypothetical protein